jgi:hypothetical protein
MAISTLYEYYTSKGQTLPSLTERSRLYEQYGLGSASSYSGSAQQNTALLSKLSSTPTSAPAPAPVAAPLPNLDTPRGVGGRIDRNTGTILSTTQPTASPLPQQGSSSLVNFATALDQAVGMARQKRNALQLGLMMPSQGTVAASDFNSILSSFKAASDNTSSNLINRAMEEATPRPSSYTEVSPGATLFDPVTGKAVYTAPTSASQKPVSSGALTLSQDEVDEAYTILKTGKAADGTLYGSPMGADGFIDPRVYLKLLDQWKQNGGLLDDFTKLYPPESFINPANTWTGTELQARGVPWEKNDEADYTATEKRKLEQRLGPNWASQPRQAQLDALYAQDDDYAGL